MSPLFEQVRTLGGNDGDNGRDRLPEVGGLAQLIVVIVGVVRQEELVTTGADHQLGDRQAGVVGCDPQTTAQCRPNMITNGCKIRTSSQ